MYQLFAEGYDKLNTVEEGVFIKENYHKTDNISIDYAVMEKANNVFVLPATFDWNDLGTWGSLYDKLPKDEYENAMVNGKLFVENATNNIIRTNRSEEHTSELQSRPHLVCRLLLEKKKKNKNNKDKER